ncbi:MAG: hypothetical protein AAGG75_06300 [Bacteroidota bacterium]
MKKLPHLLLLLVLVFLGSACSNDFDLVDEWQDIPIVYGLLSPQDEAHYIRVEKAFLDPETSALVIAQNPDSLYYQNAAVQLENLVTGEIIDLERVDGNEEGLEREEGIFATSPNYLYKFTLGPDERLEGGSRYRLTINRGDNLPLVTAETTILEDFSTTRPNMVRPLEWADYNTTQKVLWRAEPNAFIFDVRLLIHIQEEDPNNPSELIPRTLDWLVVKNLRKDESVDGTQQLRLEISGRDFYNFIGAELSDGANVRRFFVSYDYVIDAGGVELRDFLDLGNANTGITSSQIIPTYTNLSEGRGLFTSRNSFTFEGFTLTSNSLDSLKFGEFTKDLNFQ